MATSVNNSTSSSTGFLGSLTSLFTGDTAAGGQAVVDNRSFSQKYGSWDSDRRAKLLDPEPAQAEMAARFARREKLTINASAGLSENGVKLGAVTGFTPNREAANDAKIGVTTTGSNYARFAAMSGRIAA